MNLRVLLTPLYNRVNGFVNLNSPLHSIYNFSLNHVLQQPRNSGLNNPSHWPYKFIPYFLYLI